MDSIKRFQKLLPNRLLSGRYSVVRQLGSGGFSQTFLAKDTQLPGHPTCVVKQLKPQIKNANHWDVAKRLFDTEATVLYQLGNHDQIPRLLAHFEENREFYLVQEFIEGEPLSQVLPRKLWSEGQVMRRLQDLLSVLAFVHAQQIIHRDIKPSNIICRQQDNKLVLIDFGAVKQVSASFSEADQPLTISIGTQGYIASEQISGTPRFNSDIYAVGMIGIQALTGVRPNQLQRDPLTGEVLWRDLRPSVNSALADILDRMVRYHFKDRYQTVEEPLQAITALLSEWQLSPEAEEEADLEATVAWDDLSEESSIQETASQPHESVGHFVTEALSSDGLTTEPGSTSNNNAANTNAVAGRYASSPPSSPLTGQTVNQSVHQTANQSTGLTRSQSAESHSALNRLQPLSAIWKRQPSTGTQTTFGFRVTPWLLLLTVGAVIAAAVALSYSNKSNLQSRRSNSSHQSNQTAIPSLPCRELPPPTLPSTKPDYEYADGTRYYGLMNGERPADGRGIMIFPSGSRYDGEFRDGQRNGCGTYSFANGRRYIGQFKADQFDGLGIWLLGDGNRYVGAFEANRCNGEGIFLFKDGKSQRGTWRNGKLANGNLACTPEQ